MRDEAKQSRATEAVIEKKACIPKIELNIF